MKGFKRIIVLAFSVAMAVSALAFAGCEKEEGSSLSGSMKIVITPDTQSQTTVIEADLSNFTDTDSVMDVIESLAEGGKICYKGSNGVYGMYLTGLGVPVESTYEGQTSMVDSYILEENIAEGKYLYTYTSVDADKLEAKPDAEYQAMTVEYDGVTLTESMNSVSKMSICDGAIIYFTYIVWG